MQDPKEITDTKTYSVLKELPCCYNCRHSYTIMGLSLYCKNPQEWIKEASVQPTGRCNYYLSKK